MHADQWADRLPLAFFHRIEACPVGGEIFVHAGTGLTPKSGF